MLELSVCESDETGGDVSLVVGQLLYAALVVDAAADRPSNAGATWETAAAVAVSGLGHCAHRNNRRNQVNTMTTTPAADDVDSVINERCITIHTVICRG